MTKDIKTRLTLDNAEFKRKMKGTEATVKKLSSALSVGLVAAAAGVTAGFAKAIDAGSTYEATMATVKGVSKATADEFAAMDTVARKMGESTEFSASQAADGLKMLSMAGFKAGDAIDALPGVLDLATAGNIDLGIAADIASNALTAMRLETSDLSRVNDIFVKTITTSNTDMEMMAESFKYAAPVAAGFGYEIEAVSAYIGLLGNAGIQGSMAGTQLASAFTQAEKVFKEYGVTSVKADGSTKDLTDAIRLLEDNGASASKVMEIFGDRAGRSVLAMLGMGADAVEDYITQIEDAEGSTKALADTMRDTYQGDLKNFKSALESLGIDAFNTFKNEGRDAIQEVTGYIRENKEEFVKTLEAIKKGTKDVYDVVKKFESIGGPSALEWGIVGAVLFKGSKGFAAITAALITLNTNLETFDLNIGNLKDSADGAAEPLKNLWDVITGKRDWNTGEVFSEIDIELTKLLAKRKDVSESWAFTSAAREAKKEELAAIDEQIAALELQKETIKNLEAVIKESYVDPWIEAEVVVSEANTKTKVAQGLSEAELLQQRQEAYDLYLTKVQEVNDSIDKYDQQFYKDIGMYGDLYTKDQIKNLSDLEKEWLYMNAEIEDDTEKTLSIMEKNAKAVDAVYEKLFDNTETYSAYYTKAQLDDLKDIKDSWMLTNDKVVANEEEKVSKLEALMDKYVDGYKDDYSTFIDDIIKDGESLSDAWDTLWKSMAATLVDTLSGMAISWAASTISNLWTTGSGTASIFHTGLWSNMKPGETAAILEEKEMVVPSQYAEQIRANLGDNTSFSELAGATDPSGWDVQESTTGQRVGEISVLAARDAVSGLGTALIGGASISPTQMLGGYGAYLSLGLIDSAIDEAVETTMGRYGSTSLMGPSNYSRAFGTVASLANATMLGGTNPVMATVIDPMVTSFGGWLGDRVGDFFNDRDFETLRDLLDEDLITEEQALDRMEFASNHVGATQYNNASYLGSVLDMLGSAWEGITSLFTATPETVTPNLARVATNEPSMLDQMDSWSREAQNTANTWAREVIETFGLDDVVDAISEPTRGPEQGGTSEAGGEVSGSPGDVESSPGGRGGVHGGMDYIPKETTYMLDKGERVLSPRQNRDVTDFVSQNSTMSKELQKIREILSAGQYAIARNTLQMAKIIRKFDVDGLPEERAA